MIETRIRKVYYAPTKNRHYFSKDAAINAEAKAIIYKRYPIESGDETDGQYHWDIAYDETARYEKMLRRMKRKIKSASKEGQ